MSLKVILQFVLIILVTSYMVEPINSLNPKESKNFVTPLIQNGKIEEARNLSLVNGLNPNVLSYSGFITVNETCGSNLFFWFFPSQNNYTSDPVSLWLQGGPGSTSLYGILNENGPYTLNLNGTLGLRDYSWNRNSSVIYIDNPVGTGFSFTNDNPDCYARNQSKVGSDLLNALEQFFQLFPEISSNTFFISGESYAGKYVPAVAYAILKSNSTINLKGLLLGNALVDPINQQSRASFLFQIGLIDSATRDIFTGIEDDIRKKIANEKYSEAADLLSVLFSMFMEKSGYTSLYNYLQPNGTLEPNITAFVTQDNVKLALHVGNSTWNDGSRVYTFLYDDIMKSVKPWFQELLENYLVIVYNGQLDIITSYQQTLGYIDKLEWSGAEEYKNASRKTWIVDGEIAGYSKSSKRFTEVLVRNAGHMVPLYQPKWAFVLYQKFVFNQPF